MIELTNYQILGRLSEVAHDDVYLGRSRHGDQPCVIKIARGNQGSARRMAMLRHEYELTKGLDIEGIVKPLALESHAGITALILEHAGTSLSHLLETKSYDFGLERVLRIAIQLTDALGALHLAHIIHKDIEPSNIIVDTRTHRARIGDFSLSSVLSGERATLSGFGAIEGTLRYISPEQTGRMNRSIDYRSDYYSLGATLYELLTGRTPFETPDPIEMVHCHIARLPAAPHVVDPLIPETVSAVVMKLLAKTAEERYQSPIRLKADLEACLAAFRQGTGMPAFIPGLGDRSNRLRISQKLQGRDEDVATLLAAFERIRGAVEAEGPVEPKSQSEMLLVAGCSGIGKSAVINEIHKPITRQRGYFISGKFDQFNRYIPHAAMRFAFRELVHQLLTEGAGHLAWWRQRLLEALGPDGQVILDVLPEVELLVGKQPALGQLGPAETKNRFNMTFRRFVGVFATERRPLVVFLDDLQWADASSLELLAMLLASPEIHHLLLIGAYRDNEVDASHVLMLMLNGLGESRSRVHTLNLEPLQLEDVHQFVADTLGGDKARVRPLSELLAHKTHGNPFFLSQLLTRIHQQGHLSFDALRGEWQWDMKKLRERELTDNVIDLMVEAIREFDPSTQHVLKLAACIGNRFNLATLAMLEQQPARRTASELWEAVQAGLLIPVGSDYKRVHFLDELDGSSASYKFLHDRVQHAAYAYIPEHERARIHLDLAQRLLKSTSEAALDEHLFEVVTHIKMGAGLIRLAEERYQAAELNLRAARKARQSTAYEPALQCARDGVALLPEDSWEARYELTLSLYQELVTLSYLTTRFDDAERAATLVLHRARDVLDTVQVHETRIQFYVSRNKTLEQTVDVRTRELAEKNAQLSASLERIHEMQQQIVTQEKLASLGTLTAGIAHEIKNPLNFVKNFSESSLGILGELREEFDWTKVDLKGKSRGVVQELLKELGQNVQKIHEHGTRIDNIVRSMLSLSHHSTNARELSKVNDLVREYINLAYHGMRAVEPSFNVMLRMEYDPTLAEISVVPHDLGRAILNLSNNAFYAAQEKQQLLGGAFSPEVQVTTKNLGEYAEIRIRDNGSGIPDRVAANLFAPFFTTKPAGKGTGLGLSICHEIVVQEHKGSISVDTRHGEYTEFIVRLPKHPAAAAIKG